MAVPPHESHVSGRLILEGAIAPGRVEVADGRIVADEVTR